MSEVIARICPKCKGKLVTDETGLAAHIEAKHGKKKSKKKK